MKALKWVHYTNLNACSIIQKYFSGIDQILKGTHILLGKSISGTYKKAYMEMGNFYIFATWDTMASRQLFFSQTVSLLGWLYLKDFIWKYLFKVLLNDLFWGTYYWNWANMDNNQSEVTDLRSFNGRSTKLSSKRQLLNLLLVEWAKTSHQRNIVIQVNLFTNGGGGS